MQTAHKTEAAQLEAVIAYKMARYEFDQDYRDADNRLRVLKNPVVNFDIMRSGPIGQYLVAKAKGAKPEYVLYLRQTALVQIAHAKLACFGRTA